MANEPKEKIAHGKVIAAHWVDGKYSAQEVTLEVEHVDGTRTLLVVPVLRMTPTLPAVRAAEPPQ